MGNETAIAQEEFVIERVFDAPRDVVWRAYTEEERLARWWGPKGFEMVHCKVDLRPDGIFLYGMRSSEYGDMWGKFVFREIVPQEKLVFVVSFSDENAGTTRHSMSPTWPLEVLNTTIFEDVGGKTRITLRSVPINATDEERRTFVEGFESMQQGFTGTLDQLAAYLAETTA